MTWYKIAKFSLSEKELEKKIKEAIRSNPFFIVMFREYGVPLSMIDDNLHIKLEKLDDVYAKSKGDTIYVAKRIFDEPDFFQKKMHLIVHELVHWLTRIREEDSYFTDPEEIEAFMYGIAFELHRGVSKEDIMQFFVPIMKKHLDREENAEKMFMAIYQKATGIAQKMN